MKTIKYTGIGILIILAFLIAFEKPIFHSYYTFNATEVETNYSESLWYDYDTSDKISVSLPNNSKIKSFYLEPTKSYTDYLETSFSFDDGYCFIFRMSKSYLPLNSKTHKRDKLVILDKDGNKIYFFESSSEEWILDYLDNKILVFNSKENSFYYTDIVSHNYQKVYVNDCTVYDKIVLTKSDSTWNACLYSDSVPIKQITIP